MAAPWRAPRTLKEDALTWLVGDNQRLQSRHGRGRGGGVGPNLTLIAREAGIHPTTLIRWDNGAPVMNIEVADALVSYAMRTRHVGRAHAEDRLFDRIEPGTSIEPAAVHA